jgi:hypothetical protein
MCHLARSIIQYTINTSCSLSLSLYNNSSGFGFTPETTTTATQESLISFINQLPQDRAHFIPESDAMQRLEQMDVRSYRQVTIFRGPFHMVSTSNDLLSIPIYIYSKTMERKPPSAKRASKEPSGKGNAVLLERVRYFEKDKDEESEEVEADERKVTDEDLVRAYRFGKHWIPFTEEDEKLAEYDTCKSMSLVCFTHKDNVPRHTFMGNVLAVTPDPTSSSSPGLLKSLFLAMEERNHVAIVKLVKKDKGPVYLGALLPNSKGYFYFVQVLVSFFFNRSQDSL